MRTKHQGEIYIRNFIFGVEDSLVSTVGFASGIAAAGISREQIFLSGMVLIFVEAFSMGVGSFLSEDSAEEFIDRKKSASRSSVIGAAIMFTSYFICGLIPLFPYMILPVTSAMWISISLSLLALFLLGSLSAQYYKRSFLKHGLKMLLIGGIAIAAGVVVGQLA